uniref:Uncharacterized protein n=1 Tax=Arundo donax TaxID=35708 RepID=A0A0A9FGH9_ARUDO
MALSDAMVSKLLFLSCASLVLFVLGMEQWCLKMRLRKEEIKTREEKLGSRWLCAGKKRARQREADVRLAAMVRRRIAHGR